MIAVWSLGAAPSAAAPSAAVPPALLQAAGAAGLSVQEPDALPQAAEPRSTEASLAPSGLWSSLSAPDAAHLAWLDARVPGLDGSAVRELTDGAAENMLLAAAARGLSPLDFFTDPAFRGRETFYIPQALLGRMFGRWEIKVFTPYSGTAEDGVPFHMVGLLLGGGRLEILYDRAEFTFTNPELDNGRYTLQGRVTERIVGPGELEISGVWYHYGILKPRIERLKKVSPTEGRVDTSLGSRVKPASLIRLR